MWLKMLRFLKRNTEREQIMELLYLYINLSEREFIEKKGFNFLSIPLSEVHAICYRSPHNPLKKSIFFKS